MKVQGNGGDEAGEAEAALEVVSASERVVDAITSDAEAVAEAKI
jgi:hypothetical protein